MTETEVANQALSHVGASGRITSLDEATTEARHCKLHFNTARDNTLGARDWNFARRKAALARVTDTPPARWTYAYALPSDFIKVRRLDHDPRYQPAPSFEVAATETRTVLYTDEEAPVLIYTARVKEPVRWTASFQSALALGLAMLICQPITGRGDMVGQLNALFERQLRKADEENASEDAVTPPKEASWIEGR